MQPRLCSISLVALVAPVLCAQEWSRFRGPNGSGVGSADVPATWTEKDYAWKVKLPGVGNSSPVLWGERLFVTAGETKSGRRHLLCLHAADGRTLWKKNFEGVKYKMHKKNTVATSTPAVDAQRLYVAWASPEHYVVQAFDHAGQPKWEVDLGPYKSQHGFGVSLIVFEDLIICPNEQDGTSSLVALDAATGKKRWSIARNSGNATYSTPVVYQPKGRDAEIIFTNWKHGITGVDPRQGKVVWEASVFEPEKNERAIASPVIAGDLVLGTSGFVTAQKHLVALRPLRGGKVEEVWRNEKTVSHQSTPLVKDGLVFQFSEQGIVSCLDAANGKELWSERVDGTFAASPVCVGDRLYCPSQEGDVFVVAAARKYQLLGINPMGEACLASPAVAGGRMFFRTNSHVLCLAGKR